MPSELSIPQFLVRIAAAQARAEESHKRALKKAAKLVQKTAKAKLGTYQGTVGAFEAWEALHESTLNGGTSPRNGYRFRGKVELGYASEGNDNPLMRKGDLRDSIDIRVEGHEAAVGSDLVYAVAQELGDLENNMPGRSFLGASGAEKAEEIAALLGESVVINLMKPGVAYDD